MKTEPRKGHGYIVRLFKQGVSLHRIALLADVHYITVKRVLTRHGLLEPGIRNSGKEVKVYDTEGNHLGTYGSLKSAATATGMNRESVRRAAAIGGRFKNRIFKCE